MKLLFITHKIHELDDDFAFTSLWVQEFVRQGFDVHVICLEKGVHTGDFPITSLGKEKGNSILVSLLKFWQAILTIPHDRVFVHMNPKWVMAGASYWWVSRTPVYLWYTHYTMHFPLRVSHWLCKRLFASTPDSMPQYDGDPKKVITGHGIDLQFWDTKDIQENERFSKTKLLSVHRICRSKRPHLAIETLKWLPSEYTLTIYGRILEPDYYEELKILIKSLNLESRVVFKGSRPMPELKQVYPRYQIMINMAPATIDKTIIEGMFAGLQPVTTSGNAKAIGIPSAPEGDSPKAIANYILNIKFLPKEELRKIVSEKHSLGALVKKISEYIKVGN